jgi:hypothetical protein
MTATTQVSIRLSYLEEELDGDRVAQATPEWMICALSRSADTSATRWP